MARFLTPIIQDNPFGWGPCAVPEQFKDMPYQPFSKGDRLGKVADWTGATYQDKRYTSKPQPDKHRAARTQRDLLARLPLTLN
uniref:Eukaryotic translation initiation factor 3 subunit D n=1 Tax=Callorhinchus milii TaxID=7868 RepID=A0A4W3II97_CALMI